MPNVKCWNTKCEYNSNGYYCKAMEIEIDTYGDCETFWATQDLDTQEVKE